MADTSVLPKKPRLVLLVDDDSHYLSAIQELLANYGFQTLTAADGNETLALFRRRFSEIDLVLMDFNLPRVNGCELLAQLKIMAPEVKVVVASGFFGPEEEDKIARAGVAGTIPKPFRAEQLLAEINRVLAAEIDAGD